MSNYSVREKISSEVARELEEYPKIIRHLLFHRGITKKEDAEKFLKPDYQRDIHDPYLLKDMKKAVERILSAILKEEKILIYGDYDADGIPGSVILHDFFKKIGYDKFENYFPHRHNEGYGLNMEAVEQFKNKGINLIITIDCGTNDVLEVVKAQEYGIDVIITDHHLSQDEKIPPAFAIINSKQSDCDYPYDMLCGSGVIFKLIQAILNKNNFGIKEGMEKWHLDMVGLATMADMVPLQGENRAFAFFGLKMLRLSPRIGLKKLLQKNKIIQKYLCEDDIGFTIAPRINAASRMGDPLQAFQLLTAVDEASAETLADHLNKINDERKTIAGTITKEIKKVLKKRQGDDAKKVLVIGNPDWKPALLGPVANNLAEEFNTPVFIWGRADGEFIKGSCRSNGKINLSELMEHTPSDLFLTYGGHKMSGGFSISHEKIHLLESELCKAYEILTKDGIKEDESFVDLKLNINDVNWTTYNDIEKLCPFGIGNEKPLFLFENIIIDEVKLFGKEKNHLELIFRNSENKKVSSMGFFMTPENFSFPIIRGEKINLVATMEKSMFRSFPELRLRIVDIV
ncbi:MAG: single-stranded-DNA-specific exonuclease RecJ [Patescibacteria group bacterium]|nr:single-stranded-DNA-specific exonuclease RecJ [Patescibacteria group bacterium]